MRYHKGTRVRLDHLTTPLDVDSLWGPELKLQDVVDPARLQKPFDKPMIGLAMPADAVKAGEVMFLRVLAILESCKAELAKTADGRAAASRMARDHEDELKRRDEKCRDTVASYQNEVRRLERVVRKKEAETEALMKSKSDADASLCVAAVREEELLGEVGRLKKALSYSNGELQKALEEAAKANEGCSQSWDAFQAANKKNKDLEARFKAAEERAATVEDEVKKVKEDARAAMDAEFVLGFDRARQQIGVLMPEFDLTLMDPDKVVVDGQLVLDFGGDVELALGVPVAADAADGVGNQHPMDSSDRASASVPEAEEREVDGPSRAIVIDD